MTERERMGQKTEIRKHFFFLEYKLNYRKYLHEISHFFKIVTATNKKQLCLEKGIRESRKNRGKE